MLLRPSSRDDLARLLAQAHARRERVTGWDLSSLSRILSHTPEDMTVIVESGVTLAALQALLEPHGQWLPLDPPGAGTLSLEQLLSMNVSGPRRCGHGTARDHVLGLRMMQADGREIHSGGQVVKNVAGYDLHKLWIGARGSLGVITEVAFKLLPRPESEAFHEVTCAELDELARRVESVWSAPVQPVVFDAHRLGADPQAPVTLVLGFAGAREDVEWQSAWAREAGFRPGIGTSYDEAFGRLPGLNAETTVSVLQSRVVETLRLAGAGAFVTRLANGWIRWRSAPGSSPGAWPSPPSQPAVNALAARIKEAFDPHGILPVLPA